MGLILVGDMDRKEGKEVEVRKYIEKQKVIKFINDCLLYEDKLQDIEKETLLAVKKKIEDTADADVCPIMRGNWIYSDEPYPGQNPYGHYECDVCYESVPYKTRYCHKCGAFMKGEE